MMDAYKVLRTSCDDATSLQNIESINSNRLWYIRNKFTKQRMIRVYYMASIVWVGGVFQKRYQKHSALKKRGGKPWCWNWYDCDPFGISCCLFYAFEGTESNLNHEHQQILQKKCQHVKLSTPYFYLQFLVHQKNLCFFLTPNLKTKSPPSLRQPTMYVFHRASWPTEML